jgi:hypothetical protein
MTVKIPIAMVAALLASLAFSAAPALATEAPITGPVKSITASTAVFTGELNPGSSEAVAYHFAYSPNGEGCTESGLTAPEESFPEASGEHEKVSVPVTGLEGSTEYTVCLMAADFFEKEFGEATRGTEVTFTTLATKPVVESEAASTTSPSTATLEAVVNPEHQQTTCKGFDYGPTSSYGFEAACDPEEPLGSGSAGEHTSAGLTGLSANSEYHYRVVAENASGEAEDADRTFVTPPDPPTLSTRGASGVTATTANIAGTVNLTGEGYPAQDDTTYYFQYGHTTSYGGQAPLPLGNAGEGVGAREEQAPLVGLEPGTTYHYRIVASNLTNAQAPQKPQVVYGQDETFTTTATPPVLSGVSVSGVTQSGATITATLEPQNLPTRYELQLGSTPGLLQPAASGTTSTTTPLSLTVGSLSAGTAYYYRLTAVNPNDTESPVSVEGSFTTVPGPAGAALGTLPAVIPYQSIAELNAKEAKEDKGITTTKTLTRAEKLKKALKTCRKSKSRAKRAKCEATARKQYDPVEKTKRKK